MRLHKVADLANQRCQLTLRTCAGNGRFRERNVVKASWPFVPKRFTGHGLVSNFMSGRMLLAQN